MSTIAEQYKARLNDEIDRIRTDMSAASSDDTARLQERIFQYVFLPLFAGDAVLMPNVDLMLWTNYVGGPYRACNVIDQKGNVLFTVPPLYDRAAVNPMTSGRQSMYDVIASYSQLSRVHPAQGANYLDAELTKRALIMKVPSAIMENLSLWNSIFTRYGRPSIMAVAEAAKQEGNDEDSSEYSIDPM